MMRQLSLAGLLVVALRASAGPGYLPVVGPPALRFETPRPAPLAPLIPLPPLITIEPRPDPSANDSPSPGPDLSNAAFNSVLTDPFAVPEIAGPVPTPATSVAPSAPAETETLVPQMFMKYFTGRTGTNLSGVSLYAPVGFVPPLPIVPVSSSATFQTTPADKP